MVTRVYVTNRGGTIYILGNPPRVLITEVEGDVIVAGRELRYVEATFTSTLFTGALSAGKVAATATLINGAAAANDATFAIVGVELVSKPLVVAGFDLWFLRDSIGVGTLGGTFTVADADAINAKKFISLDKSEQKNLGACYKWAKDGYYVTMLPKLTTDDLYVALVCTDGTPTYASGDLVLGLWIE
jgi:hypothetical protein